MSRNIINRMFQIKERMHGAVQQMWEVGSNAYKN